MKRYLFLKLGLTILVCAAATPRTQVSDNFGSSRDGNKQRNNNKNDFQTTVSSSLQGDPKNNLQDYQGVMGKPGVDFPVLTYIPRTKFTCRGKKSGYYADLETNCQVFHICDEGRKVSFLCPNGTIFQQSDLICDWWFKVDCAISPTLYDESAEQLYEETVRRKENRKVQEQERRASKINRNQNNNIKQFDSRRSYPNSRENSSNTAKKDVNQYTSNQNENVFSHSSENHGNGYKESQLLSETASFVSNRYNDEQQKKYFKSFNDVRQNTQNYETTKSYNDFGSVISTSEKIFNRGSRTYSNTFASNKVQYNNQVPGSLKTTTQHTIYSPTVPPFTSTRYTTNSPITTQAYRSKTIPTVRIKPVSGFYITKELNHGTTLTPFVTDFPSTVQTLTENAVPKFYQPVTNSPFPFTTSPTSLFKEYQNNDFDINSRFRSTNNKFEFSTISPFDDISKNTVTPSIPTPFKIRPEDTSIKNIKATTLEDESFTNHNTYLPKSNNRLSTPKPTIPTEYTTLNTFPTVTENLNNMIKTLQELDENTEIQLDKNLGARPGLNIPPSAGPKTLHSLAIYFASALDNLVSLNDTTNDNITEEQYSTTPTIDEDQVTLLSRITQEKYNLLFNERSNNNNNTSNMASTDVAVNEKSDLDLRSLIEHDAQFNDLDGQQSRGPVSSTPRIRQLAQVFTQALSAYLDDPGTFKKVLEEIRPTEPPFLSENLSETLFTTLPSTITTEYRSYTKEEDEVLDFSDADKSSTYKPFTDNIMITQPTLYVRSTTEAYLNEISTAEKNSSLFLTKRVPTPNPLALDLNNRLKETNIDAIEELSVEANTESDDYFPFHTGHDEEDARLKATAQPYGVGIKPQNSTPQIPPTGEFWDNFNILSNNSSTPANSLLPPFKISLIGKNDETNSSYTLNEEYLQSAHSQSFIPQTNQINLERKGKSFSSNLNNNLFTTTESDSRETNTFTTTSIPDTTTPYFTTESTTSYKIGIENRFATNRYFFDETTTEYPSTTQTTTHFAHEYSTFTDTPTTTTLEATTQSKAVPNNHWSTSPEVTKLWESALYIDPLIINQNLSESESSTYIDTYTPTTYKPDLSTQPYRPTTEYYDDDIVDIIFSSTTEDPTDIMLSSTLPSTTEPGELYTSVIDLGIHNLLNSTELEIASSQANQIFGNLDRTEQDILIEKMKEAESNSTVRRLILLLVSTCDASLSNNKTVQETRNSILHALLNVPSSTNSSPEISNRLGKQISFNSDENLSEVTTSASETTTSVSTELSRKSSAIVSSIEFPNKTVNVKNVHEDTRALELLRSLYSLAAKWGKK